MKSGAGGQWKTIGEREDPTVPKQSDSLGCVAATGEMLLKAHGRNVPQRDVLAKIGLLADPRSLAPVLNEVDTLAQGGWQGFIIEPTRAAFDELTSYGAWGTAFREGSPVGHFVLIDGLTESGLVKVKDPYPLTPQSTSGTSYSMEWAEFIRVWSGEVVFNENK